MGTLSIRERAAILNAAPRKASPTMNAALDAIDAMTSAESRAKMATDLQRMRDGDEGFAGSPPRKMAQRAIAAVDDGTYGEQIEEPQP